MENRSDKKDKLISNSRIEKIMKNLLRIDINGREANIDP